MGGMGSSRQTGGRKARAAPPTTARGGPRRPTAAPGAAQDVSAAADHEDARARLQAPARRGGRGGRAKLPAGLDSHAGFTLAAGEPIVVADAAAEGRFPGAPLLGRHGVVSGASVVVAGHPRPWGVLAAHATSRRDFTADEVHFLRAAANILAAAVRQRQAEQALRDSEERMR